jgi:hypothetical protein
MVESLMADSFPIDRGIPLPKRQNGYHKYPFQRMKVGESFMVACADFETQQLMNSLTSCARWAGFKTGFKFAQRKIPGGVRVWRVL